MIYHIVISVAGMVRAPDSELEYMLRNTATGEALTPSAARTFFVIQQMRGVKVMPFGEPCEGFCPIHGCPGHEKDQ